MCVVKYVCSKYVVGALMSYKKQVVLGGHLSMATPSVTGSSGEDEWPLKKLNFNKKYNK
jgi:hypothetical protein